MTQRLPFSPSLAAFLLLAVLFAPVFWMVGTKTLMWSMSLVIYAKVGLAGLLLSLILLMGAVLAERRLGPSRLELIAEISFARISPWVIAVVAIAVTAIGVDLVYLGTAISADEQMTRFQGEIFAQGGLVGTIPEELRPYSGAVAFGFTRQDPTSGAIASTYRPGMAALYALFAPLGLGAYASTLLLGASVFLAAAVARQIWPDRRDAAVLAALLVATSSQALAAALTSYAMSAHLAFNLLWLWLFLHNRNWSHGLAALVGIATAALHQVHVHAFFALPFLLSLLHPFRLRLCLWYGATYAIGHLGILAWDPVGWAAASVADGAAGTGAAVATGAAAGAGGGASVLGLIQGLLVKIGSLLRPGSWVESATLYANLVRLLAWQNLALVPLLVAFAVYGRWSRITVLLAASLVVSFLPYPLLMPDQGHGWGYRYMHGLIGNLALLATAGWVALSQAPEPEIRRLRAAIVLLLLVTPLPLVAQKAIGIHGFAATFQRSMDEITAMPADIVVIDDLEVNYGMDLMQNAPDFTNRPLRMRLSRLTAEQIRTLCADHSLARLGMGPLVPFGGLEATALRERDPGYRAADAALRACVGQTGGAAEPG
ncbi:MAG: hypothetical protein ACFBRM_09195 [Pikeienuella sp.]